MAQDEKLKPLLNGLWQSVVDAFQQVEERVGASLNELLAIPQGEVCIALAAPPEGPPQLVAWMDCGDQMPTMQRLLERGEEALAQQGSTRTTETIGDTELVVHQTAGRRERSLVYFVKDNSLVVSSSVEFAKQLLAMWNGEEQAEVMTLADNRKFTSIMSRCQGGKGEEPQVTWFIDPLEMVRRFGRGNIGVQTTLAVLQGLGLDGFKSVGGSLLFATEEFDGIFHTHVLLDHPRTGTLEALALGSGDVTPEPWVPSDAASYTTVNWEVPKTYAEVVRLYEMFRGGEGVWKEQALGPIEERLGVDFERDIIDGVAGRFSMVTWMEKPVRINSQTTMIGIKLKDAAATQKVLEQVVERFPEQITRQTYGGVTYYQGQPQQNADINPEIVRLAEGCGAILGDYLLISDSVQMLQRAIVTKGDPSGGLANELDFKIVASKIRRQLGDQEAGMIAFHRPEEAIRQVYEMAASETMRGALRGRAEGVPFLKSIDTTLNQNPLPPFAVLAQYLAPGGALITSDETGFHYMAFSLRRGN